MSSVAVKKIGDLSIHLSNEGTRKRIFNFDKLGQTGRTSLRAATTTTELGFLRRRNFQFPRRTPCNIAQHPRTISSVAVAKKNKNKNKRKTLESPH